MKQIPVCELYPEEAIKTNVIGVQNVIKAAIAQKVQKVINVSSDKATYPLNTYGMTKALGEKLIIEANKLGSTQFVCVRGGNVLGSNGSVVPLFINAIKTGNEIKITHKEMTRFFLTLPEAIKLLLVASSASIPGGIFVMKMPACRIMDLARVLHRELAPDKVITYTETGIRPGEKIHEVLLNPYETMQAYIHGDNYYVISPTDIGLPKIDIKEYSSNEKLLDEDGIKELLIKGEFL
jgi:UDP-N-acetylglucosamine 4,6-dehydratase/5-epimerase